MSRRAVGFNRLVERVVNRGVRTYDGVLGRLHLGGRRADYDDLAYEFEGGANDALRAKHYDKSLRLLWKAEQHAPWSSFRDANPLEKELQAQAEKSLSVSEQQELRRIRSQEFRELLDREYTTREKQALVNILSAIGHGEAYAWLVAADLVGTVKSTGAKAASAAQVIEEAKHFVVLRELVHAFGVPVPRLSAWEYVLLEQVMKLEGLEKFFGMNVVVEGIALSMFGALSHLPGMEILRLFHLDESRHAALPVNYLRDFPLSTWQKHSPFRRVSRLRLLLPAVPLVFALEEDCSELGIDAFEFGGAVIRKVAKLAERAGFYLPLPIDGVSGGLNLLFNAYCKATRDEHRYRDFRTCESTRGRRELAVERQELALA
jgi:hypothetical protein